MTWREFELRARGYFLRLARQKWMTRELIWHLLAVNGVTDTDRRDIMILPWDEDEPPSKFKDITPQELADIGRRFEEIENRNKKAAE